MRRWAAVTGLILAIAAAAGPDDNTIQIVLQKSHYTPDRIVVKKGKPVALSLKSIDVTHGMAIDEFKIFREVSPGPPVVIRFTPDRAGTFTFYCAVRCGKGHLKMRGTLVVEN